ncbi:unnamed protein product, partial [Amoebophrya sp. A25]
SLPPSAREIVEEAHEEIRQRSRSGSSCMGDDIFFENELSREDQEREEGGERPSRQRGRLESRESWQEKTKKPAVGGTRTPAPTIHEHTADCSPGGAASSFSSRKDFESVDILSAFFSLLPPQIRYLDLG